MSNHASIKQMVFLTSLVIIFALVGTSVNSLQYYLYQTNFAPGEARTHLHNVSFTGNFSMTIPTGFNLSWYTGSPVIDGNKVTWKSPETNAKYTFTSPSYCIEGEIYKSTLYENGVYVNDFIYVCIPDEKIVDCKYEYGHGEGNYLTEPYISNQSIMLFTLIRVWNIGDRLNPDEEAFNASMNCVFPRYPVRTFGYGEFDYNPTSINASFFWDIIRGYWFRISVISMDISGQKVGSNFDVNCTNITYHFKHQAVNAKFPNCSLEIRTMAPFNFTCEDHPTDPTKQILTLSNQEEYGTYDISFDRYFDGFTHTESYQQLMPDESVTFIVDRSSYINRSIFFIPSWFYNAFSPEYYSQKIACIKENRPPVLDFIPTLYVYVNQTLRYDSNGTDPDGDVIWFWSNSSIFVINRTTGVFTFRPNFSQIGNYSINITIYDPYNLTDSQVFKIVVLSNITLDPPVLEPYTDQDGISVDLNWTDVGAEYYNLYYSDNPFNFSLVANVSGIPDTNYTDRTGNKSRIRYYKVEAYKQGLKKSSNIGCKYTYDWYSSGSGLKGKNYMALVCNRTISAEQLLSGAGIKTSYLTRLSRENPEEERFISHPRGSTVNNYTLKLGEGYLIFVVKNVTHTLTGRAVLTPITLNLISSGDGLKGANWVGMPYSNTGHTAETFISGILNNYGSYITRLNRNNPEVEYYESHPRGSTVNNYVMFPEGRGYHLFVTHNATYTPS